MIKTTDVPGSYIVTYRHDAPDSAIDKGVELVNSTPECNIGNRYSLIAGFSAVMTADLVAHFEQTEFVENVVPDQTSEAG